MFKHVLLCTHGTPGAQKAEAYVFENLAALPNPPQISLLTIINEDWKFMGGDDWLNTDKARMQFFHHLGEQLGREVEEDWERIKAAHPRSDQASFNAVVGQVEETMARAASELGCDLVVAGGRQKKQGKGFKARLDPKKLHPLLPCPLLIAP